jgi:hypothetical protein
MKTSFAFTAILIALSVSLAAQSPKDSIPKDPGYKNVIRYNLSGALLFGFDYVVLGYERVLKNNQSFSVNAGQAVLPKIIDFNLDSVSIKNSFNNTGFNFSADYRFYLKKENRHQAPRGVYIGPYYSFNNFKRDSEWTFNRPSSSKLATANTEFTIHTIGAEMGYQFVLWKRMTLDFVLIGPGVSSYSLKTGVGGNLSDADRELVQDALLEMINNRFPGMDYVIGDNTFNGEGNLRTWSSGFRYLIHVGFRF